MNINSNPMHPAIRALMFERRKRMKRYQRDGVDYSRLLRNYTAADENHSIDNLIVEAARCRVRCSGELEYSAPLEIAAREARLHMLELIMHNYDECGSKEIWECEPHALVSLIHEFQVYLAHAIIGTPEVVYSFGRRDDNTRGILSDADKRLAEYAGIHGWVSLMVEGGESGNANYVMRDANTLGVTANSDDDEIRMLYDAFTCRFYAFIALNNIVDYHRQCEIHPEQKLDCFTRWEEKLLRGFVCSDEHNTDYDTTGNIQYIIFELGRQIRETAREDTITRSSNIKGLGETLEKATEFHSIAACDISLGYTALGREQYMLMIDTLLDGIRSPPTE